MVEMYRSTPVILVPAAVGPAPFGLQLTAGRGEDARVLQTVVRLESVIYVSRRRSG